LDVDSNHGHGHGILIMLYRNAIGIRMRRSMRLAVSISHLVCVLSVLCVGALFSAITDPGPWLGLKVPTVVTVRSRARSRDVHSKRELEAD
jgi:hypothetical protein